MDRDQLLAALKAATQARNQESAQRLARMIQIFDVQAAAQTQRDHLYAQAEEARRNRETGAFLHYDEQARALEQLSSSLSNAQANRNADEINRLMGEVQSFQPAPYSAQPAPPAPQPIPAPKPGEPMPANLPAAAPMTPPQQTVAAPMAPIVPPQPPQAAPQAQTPLQAHKPAVMQTAPPMPAQSAPAGAPVAPQSVPPQQAAPFPPKERLDGPNYNGWDWGQDIVIDGENQREIQELVDEMVGPQYMLWSDEQKRQQARRQLGLESDPNAQEVASSFLEGLTLGHAGEVTGLVGAGITSGARSLGIDPNSEAPKGFGEQYQFFKDRADSALESGRRDHPDQTGAMEVAGILPTFVLPGIRAGKTLAGRALGGAGTGAAYAGAYTMGTGDGGIDNRAMGAITDPMTSAAAALGGAIPLVGRGAASLGKFSKQAGVAAAHRAADSQVMPKLFRDRIKAQLGPKLPRAQQEAIARLQNAAQEGGISPAQIQGRMSQLGDEAMVIDALGEVGGDAGRSAANTSPVASETLIGKLDGRQARQEDRIVNLVEDITGASQVKTQDDILKELYDETRPAIRKAYQAAEDAGQGISLKDFDWIGGTPEGRAAMRRGERHAWRQAASESPEDFIGPVRPNNLEILDATKKIFDDLGQPDTKLHKVTPEQALYRKDARKLREGVDDVLPEYGGARSLSRNAFAREKAIKLGAEAGEQSPIASIGADAAGVSRDHMPDVLKGYGTEVLRRATSARNTPGTLDRLFGSTAQQRGMEAALGADAKRLQSFIGNEGVFNASQRAVKGNSTTARQLKQLGLAAGSGLGAGGLGALAGYQYNAENPQSGIMGGLAGLALSGAGRFGRGIRQAAAQKFERDVANEIAEMLTQRQAPPGIMMEAAKPNVFAELMAAKLLANQAATQATP